MKRQRIMRAGILKTLGIFSFFLLCASSLWAAAPEDRIRQAIIERLLDNDKQSIKQETPVSAEHIKKMTAQRIGIDLSVHADNISGIDFEFVERGGTESNLLHVGVWVFTYTDKEIANNKDKKIVGSHFKQSKILIPFFHFVDDNKIVIVFTESAGNKSVANFIASFCTYNKCTSY
ncbi:MAG: hypothetical protein LBF61_10580 [Azoarcus sp.]|jgi:hypothetical protein|nr:hypothetical protein [Azoarcus sp.]